MNLVEAIEFPVFVNGKPMTASVIEVNENPVQYSYKIQFSDGYEDIFTLDEGLIEADNGGMSKPYIRAIRNDIMQVIGLDTNNFYHIFQESIDGIMTNVWIIEKEDENYEIYYGVYYNGHYRFELRNVDGEWIWSTKSKEADASIDEGIAKKVYHIVDSMV